MSEESWVKILKKYLLFHGTSRTSKYMIEWAVCDKSSNEWNNTDEEPVGILHKVETRKKNTSEYNASQSVAATSIMNHNKKGKI